jgi:hypothetical protein
VDLLLLRMGKDVTGGYSNGKVDGFIEGDIRNGVLHFTWREGNANGKGIAEAQGETLRGSLVRNGRRKSAKRPSSLFLNPGIRVGYNA